MSSSGDLSSKLRKRALRRLAREQPAAYAAIYERVRPEEPGGVHARGKTWTLLREQFPDRYLELFAEEQVAPETEIPADIRAKSWNRATSNLADLHADRFNELHEQFSAKMPQPRAYDRAVAALRQFDEPLFTRLLAEEYKLWLIVTGHSEPTGEDELPVRDHLREAVRWLHRPLWYRVPFTGRPEGQAWLVCDGCNSDSPPSWPCETAKLVYAPEEIKARKPQVPECPDEGHAHHRAIFWQQADGTLTARRGHCDHLAPVPVTSSDLWT